MCLWEIFKIIFCVFMKSLWIQTGCLLSVAEWKDTYQVIMLWKLKTDLKGLSKYRNYYHSYFMLGNSHSLLYMSVFFIAEAMIAAESALNLLSRDKHINIYMFSFFVYSWYCKNMNRSQAEKLLRNEVMGLMHTMPCFCTCKFWNKMKIKKKKCIVPVFWGKCTLHA